MKREKSISNNVSILQLPTSACSEKVETSGNQRKIWMQNGPARITNLFAKKLLISSQSPNFFVLFFFLLIFPFFITSYLTRFNFHSQLYLYFICWLIFLEISYVLFCFGKLNWTGDGGSTNKLKNETNVASYARNKVGRLINYCGPCRNKISSQN